MTIQSLTHLSHFHFFVYLSFEMLCSKIRFRHQFVFSGGKVQECILLCWLNGFLDLFVIIFLIQLSSNDIIQFWNKIFFSNFRSVWFFFNKAKSRGNDLVSHISHHFFQMSHFPIELINIYVFKSLLIFLHFFHPRYTWILSFYFFTLTPWFRRWIFTTVLYPKKIKLLFVFNLFWNNAPSCS